MARPKKENIDYFPHYCEHGKTLFIIESLHGNDGYAFFYKLLERLGKSRGHFIDCRNTEDWEFLRAKTHVTEEITENILNKLSSMGKIDADLWSMRIIWMQSFVDSISDVYKNRRVEIPTKPSFYEQKTNTGDVSTAHNPQSKVNKSKVNNNKEPNGSLSETEKIVSDGNGKYPPCPQSEIISLYHKELPELPRVKHWPENLQVILRTRWKENPVRQNLEWWEQFYRYVHESDFLMGRTKEAFVADLEWLVRPKNFTKIANGRYHGRGNLSAKPQPGIAAWLAGRRENAATG